MPVLCVCMYVCVYVCMYVCVYVCMYVSMPVCVCTYVSMAVSMYVCVYVCEYVCVLTLKGEHCVRVLGGGGGRGALFCGRLCLPLSHLIYLLVCWGDPGLLGLQQVHTSMVH